MKSTKKKIILYSFCVSCICLIIMACGPGSQKNIPQKYPEGFSLTHPKDWQVQVIEKKYIFASGKENVDDSSLVLIYPFFLRDRLESQTWLRQNLLDMNKFFTEVKLGEFRQVRQRPDESTVEFSFTRNGSLHSGLALCSIFENSGMLYVIGASTEDFNREKNPLIKILESFRFEEAGDQTSKASALPKTKYVTWQDPVENAFSLDVPQGWKVEGGTYRRASVDLVHVLLATSPDQKLRIQFNDANIPAFTAPSPMLAMAGFTEGSWYSPGYGVRMLVKRYTPGYHFLNEYLRQNYVPVLNDFQWESQNERPDIAGSFNRLYSQYAAYGISFSLHAGETAFRFQKNGSSQVGYGIALTQIVQSMGMQGGTWSVPLLVIYTCPEEEAEMVHTISDHMFKSVRVNPQWEASQQQLAANVSQIVTQTNQEISNIINNSYWSRQRTMDDINRRFSNYILGMTDVVDPVTGDKWKVESGHNYYWRKDYTGQVIGTEVFERPNIDFSPLKEY